MHVDRDTYAALAASAGLTLAHRTVTDCEWDYCSRNRFREWCAVGSTAWSDRLPVEDRGRFIDDQIGAYQNVGGRPGLFRYHADAGRIPALTCRTVAGPGFVHR